ncbi:MAG TPA: tripartite tricarboxylate transporter substrate binding protein, partial [Bordetella sp.]|nr:tripartite tricarboxylate transporter substrate binding protein [Bordetella sp.]
MQPLNPHFRQGRRGLLGAVLAAALGLGLSGAPVQAAEFPDRPVRMVVPFGPGTTTDTIARIIADAMAKPLGQQVV